MRMKCQDCLVVYYLVCSFLRQALTSEAGRERSVHPDLGSLSDSFSSEEIGAAVVNGKSHVKFSHYKFNPNDKTVLPFPPQMRIESARAHGNDDGSHSKSNDAFSAGLFGSPGSETEPGRPVGTLHSNEDGNPDKDKGPKPLPSHSADAQVRTPAHTMLLKSSTATLSIKSHRNPQEHAETTNLTSSGRQIGRTELPPGLATTTKPAQVFYVINNDNLSGPSRSGFNSTIRVVINTRFKQPEIHVNNVELSVKASNLVDAAHKSKQVPVFQAAAYKENTTVHPLNKTDDHGATNASSLMPHTVPANEPAKTTRKLDPVTPQATPAPHPWILTTLIAPTASKENSTRQNLHETRRPSVISNASDSVQHNLTDLVHHNVNSRPSQNLSMNASPVTPSTVPQVVTNVTWSQKPSNASEYHFKDMKTSLVEPLMNLVKSMESSSTAKNKPLRVPAFEMAQQEPQSVTHRPALIQSHRPNKLRKRKHHHRVHHKKKHRNKWNFNEQQNHHDISNRGHSRGHLPFPPFPPVHKNGARCRGFSCLEEPPEHDTNTIHQSGPGVTTSTRAPSVRDIDATHAQHPLYSTLITHAEKSATIRGHLELANNVTELATAVQSSHQPKNFSRTLNVTGLGRSLLPGAMLHGDATEPTVKTQSHIVDPALASHAEVVQSAILILNETTHSATTLDPTEQLGPPGSPLVGIPNFSKATLTPEQTNVTTSEPTVGPSGGEVDGIEKDREIPVVRTTIKYHPLEVLDDPQALLQSHVPVANMPAAKHFHTLRPNGAIPTTAQPPITTTRDPNYGNEMKTFVKELLVALQHTLNATSNQVQGPDLKDSTATDVSLQTASTKASEDPALILRVNTKNSTSAALNKTPHSMVTPSSNAPPESLGKLSSAIQHLVDAIQRLQPSAVETAAVSVTSKAAPSHSTPSPASLQTPLLPAIVILKEPGNTLSPKPPLVNTKNALKNNSDQFPPLDAVIIRIRTPTGSVLELHANSTSSLWKDVQQMLQVFKSPSVVPAFRSLLSLTTPAPPLARPTTPLQSQLQPPTTVPKFLKESPAVEAPMQVHLDNEELSPFMDDSNEDNGVLDLKPRKFSKGWRGSHHKRPKKPLSPVMSEDSVRSVWALLKALKEQTQPQDVRNRTEDPNFAKTGRTFGLHGNKQQGAFRNSQTPSKILPKIKMPSTDGELNIERKIAILTSTPNVSNRSNSRGLITSHGRGIGGRMLLVPLTERPQISLTNNDGRSKFENFDESLVYKDHFGTPEKLRRPYLISNSVPETTKADTTKRPLVVPAGRGIAPVMLPTESPTREQTTTTAAPVAKGRVAPAIKGRAASGTKQTFTLHDVLIMALMKGKIKP